MAHFIDTMAYAGETPWHTLGNQLPADAPTAEMQPAAGVDWRAVKVPLFQALADGAGYRPVAGVFGIARSDTGLCLEGVSVGDEYTPFQNADLFGFGDALTATGEARWHTAGSLKGGRRIWALAQVAGGFEVRNETHAPFLLLHNAHDGTARFSARFTGVRVVCWNTLSAALGRDRTEVGVFHGRHTASLKTRAAEAAEILGLARTAFEAQADTLRGFADAPMDTREFGAFVDTLLTETAESVEQARETIARAGSRSQAILDRKRETLTGLFKGGHGNRGRDRYDAINAVTEFVDYQRGRAARAHKLGAALTAGGFESAVWGSGEKLKKRALRLLTRW